LRDKKKKKKVITITKLSLCGAL
jgi:hypothetical protein